MSPRPSIKEDLKAWSKRRLHVSASHSCQTDNQWFKGHMHKTTVGNPFTLVTKVTVSPFFWGALLQEGRVEERQAYIQWVELFKSKALGKFLLCSPMQAISSPLSLDLSVFKVETGAAIVQFCFQDKQDKVRATVISLEVIRCFSSVVSFIYIVSLHSHRYENTGLTLFKDGDVAKWAKFLSSIHKSLCLILNTA